MSVALPHWASSLELGFTARALAVMCYSVEQLLRLGMSVYTGQSTPVSCLLTEVVEAKGIIVPMDC